MPCAAAGLHLHASPNSVGGRADLFVESQLQIYTGNRDPSQSPAPHVATLYIAGKDRLQATAFAALVIANPVMWSPRVELGAVRAALCDGDVSSCHLVCSRKTLAVVTPDNDKNSLQGSDSHSGMVEIRSRSFLEGGS